jgi:hypothetical protein
MAGDTACRSAHHGMMVRDMAGNRARNRAADAAFRLGRCADSQAGWKDKDQGGTNDTHGSLPHCFGNGSNVPRPTWGPIKSATS